MDQLGELAAIFQSYGSSAVAALASLLYLMERRERRATQEKYEKYLVAVPGQMREFADMHTSAIDSLERAFLRSGIDTEQPKAESEDT